MTNCLYSRGPDDKVFWIDKKNCIALGHRRLSILELSKLGKQPMFSNNKRYIAVYNGCIYNFLEIKKFLKSKNINFLTNSDTEVVANAYMYFGEKSFNYFDGMWAIAIYDNEKKEYIMKRLESLQTGQHKIKSDQDQNERRRQYDEWKKRREAGK